MTAPDPRPVSVATPVPADSHGAADLSTHTGTPAPAESTAPVAGEGLHIPLITTTDEENFRGVMSTSRAVPVIMIIRSPRLLESKPTLAMLGEITRGQAGKLQLVEADTNQTPTTAQAFQIQGVPTVVALVGERPIPLLQGAASKEQVLPIAAQVLDTAAQMDITTRVTVTAEDTIALTPSKHGAPLVAEAAGNPDETIAGWQKVIELSPRDGGAKSHLSCMRLATRSVQADATDPAARADVLLAAGDAAGTFDVLLDLFAAFTNAEERGALHLRLLDLFHAAGSSPEISKVRARLATLLM